MAQKEMTLEDALASAGAFVSYVPLRTEVPFRDFVALPRDAVEYVIAPRATLDPLAEALNAMRAIDGRPACVLMPGRRFDAAGTRHGQGGGWYDRFLSRVPREWTRVGFCFERQFSEAPLPREEWDQAVDLVVVITPDGTLWEYGNPGS